MLSGDDNESRYHQLKNNLQHTFLVHFFAVALHDYNETETSQLQPFVTSFMEKMLFLYVLLFPFFFFSSPLIFPLVAATSIYHFLIVSPLLFFLYFFQRNWSPLFFISRSSSFSLIHVNRVIDSQCQRKLSRRTDDFLN